MSEKFDAAPEEHRVESLHDPIDKSEIQIAQIAEDVEQSKPSATSWMMFRLYAILSVGYFCIILQGYDGSLMGAINAVPEYLRFFNLEQASSGTGLVFAMYNIGCISALPFAGPLNDHYGRRWGMFVGGFWVIIGTCIMAPAINTHMFLFGRWCVGLGQGFLNVAGITYVTEMAHPYFRGPLGAFLETNYYVGSIIASWVAYGTATMVGSNSSWRIPIWLQMVSSVYICVGVFFIPETPRWLMARERYEEAEAVLAKYHGEGSAENPFVRLQLVEMRAQISSDGSDKRWWDYSGLVNTPSARRRLVVVVAFAWFGQYSGNALVSYYFPVIVSQSGIKDAKTQLLLNALNPVCSWVAAIGGSLVADRAGRRPLLLAGFIGCVITLTIMTVLSYLSVVNASVPAGHAGIFFIYLFGVVFSFCITPLQPFYISEILDTENRAKGNAAGQLVAGIAGIVGQYTTGVALGKIGYYYYIVFIFWDIFEVIIIYFFFPETKGRTLEEINEIFDDPKPVKKSLEKRTHDTVLNTTLKE